MPRLRDGIELKFQNSRRVEGVEAYLLTLIGWRIKVFQNSRRVEGVEARPRLDSGAAGRVSELSASRRR